MTCPLRLLASVALLASSVGAQDSVSRELVVRVLDVGQGDAVLITNGGSRVLIDGGPTRARLGWLLDSLGLNGTTMDVVILSHPHMDHYSGLRELFEPRRRIAVRYFIEAGDVSPSVALRQLRALVFASASRGQLEYRDADDPCGDGSALCTMALRGGALLHVMRPDPAGGSANDRSVPVKLVGPDSASLTMWLAGDAERDAIQWLLGASGYAKSPGLHVNVLKSDHHGSCNGVTSAYASAMSPDVTVISVGARNPFGHVHSQTERVWRDRKTPWYRTDRNGTITIRSSGKPGAGYIVNVQRGHAAMRGPGDAPSTQAQCNPMP